MSEYIKNPNERGAYPNLYDELEPEPESDLKRMAAHMGTLFQFFCESGQVDVVGRRVLVVGFNLRPDMFDGIRSEAELAKCLGMTRAGANKILREFRDTFGIRTVTMRNEETRERCRRAQLKR